MVKHTHLTERCSSFLRTGTAWRLKRHGYTFAEAYWRLREGKGLISSTDREALKVWGNLITKVRRQTGVPLTLTSSDREELQKKKSALLERMEEYRDRLEQGNPPTYLHEQSSPAIVEHLLVNSVGDVSVYDTSVLQQIWEELDVKKLMTQAIGCMKEVEEYTQTYCTASTEQKELMPAPDVWTKHRFGNRFLKDKVWQIRTGHDQRSSVNAEINRRLMFIWDIPSTVGTPERDIFDQNMKLLENYTKWKEDKCTTDNDYDTTLREAHDVLDGIIIPG